MDEHELLSLITIAKSEFGATCKKFAGALTVQLLKEALCRNGIETSARDVFIEKIPVEIDLLVPRVGVVPRHGILYRPEDALVAFEVKNAGSFGQGTITQTKKTFGLICAGNPQIQCAYVTVQERLTFKHAVTAENLNYPAFTLFSDMGFSEKKCIYEASGDFGRLLAWLRAVLCANP